MTTRTFDGFDEGTELCHATFGANCPKNSLVFELLLDLKLWPHRQVRPISSLCRRVLKFQDDPSLINHGSVTCFE